jgi:hypothetical protein
MREWPESFLTPGTIATGALATKPERGVNSPPRPASGIARPAVARVAFEGLQVALWSADAAVLQRGVSGLGLSPGTPASNVIANLELARTGDGVRIADRGTAEATTCSEADLRAVLRRQVATRFALARHQYAWLEAAAFAANEQGIVLAGELGADDEPWRHVLGGAGWEIIDDALIALRVADGMIVPLGARSQPEGAAAQAGRVATPFARLAIATKAPPHVRNTLAPISPAAAVAALIGASLDFRIERSRAVRHLCRMVEGRTAVQVHWSEPEEAAKLLVRWAQTPTRGAE